MSVLPFRKFLRGLADAYFALLNWGVRRIISGRTLDLTEVASKIWEISPKETATIRPAIHLDRALDRVVSLAPWRSWETEYLYIQGGRVDHAASQAYRIKDADICGAFLYCGAAKAQPGFGSQRLVVREHSAVSYMEAAHFMSSWVGSTYFGQYMRDIMPLQLLLPESASGISVVTRPYEHDEGYRDLLSLPRPPRVDVAHVEKLTVYTDFAQNSSKAARYRVLRKRLRSHFATGPRSVAPGIYLKRGRTGEQRIVSNETDIEEVLSDLGFDIVEPAKLSPSEIVSRMLDAPIVVGVEGSHLAHAIYTIAEHGTFLVLQPPDRFALPYKEYTDRLDMGFAFVVGHPSEDGFTVDIDELKRILDLIL